MKSGRALLLIAFLATRPSAAQGPAPSRFVDQGPVFFTVARDGERVDARNSAVMRRRIAVDLQDASVAEALDTIAARSGLTINYNATALAGTTPVTLKTANIAVGAALSAVLFEAGVDVELSRDVTHLVLIPRDSQVGRTMWRARQDDRITGRAIDYTTRQPIPAAAVTVTGTTIGQNTSDSGTFSLRLPADAKSLTVRRIGYLAATALLVRGQTDYTVELRQDVLRLDAQLVTGVATTVSSQNAANAVGVVDAQQVNEVPAPTVENAIQAEIPGVLVQQNNGGAPGGGMQVQVRGITSIYANASPLYVVDGVVVDNETVEPGNNAITQVSGTIAPSVYDNGVNRIADINPDDIETLEVLKGASASAIYGSKASAGVIVITTKKGKAGKAAWNFSQKVGHFADQRTLPIRTFPTVASAQGWYNNDVEGIYDAQTHTDTGATLAANNAYIASLYAGPQNYQTQLFGSNQLSYETDLSVSGTQGGTQYFLSGLSKYDNGTLLNTGYNKQTIRSNVTEQFSSRISATANLFYAHDVTRRGITGFTNTGLAINPYDVFTYTPQFVNLDHQAPDGTWAVNPFGPANPFADAYEIGTPETTNRFIGGGSIDLTPYTSEHQSVQVRFLGGADIAHVLDALYAPPDLQIEQTTELPGVSTTQTSDIQYLNYSINAIHRYSGFSWLDATTSAGFVAESRSLVNPETVSQDLLAGINNPASGTVQTNFYNRTAQRDQSLYGQEQLLLLDERLSVTAGVTAERSTNDGDIDKFYAFPRYSASYRIPQFAGFLDALKLRAAFGASGTQPLYGVRYSPLGSILVGGRPGVSGDSAVGAANVKPETETEFEMGFDATLFHSRAQFTATVYQKQITNLLLQAAVNPSRGYVQEWLNGGEFTNQGIELAFQATPVQLKNGFTWLTSTSFYRNYSVVNSLPVPAFSDAPNGGYGWIQVGRSVSEMVNVGVLDPNGAPEQVGDSYPSYVMSFNNSLTYGGFRIAGLLDWSRGNDVSNVTAVFFDFSSLWGDSAYAAKGAQQIISSQLAPTQSGTYVKLRSLTASYTLPSRWVDRLPSGRVASARLSLEARNLVSWFSGKYTGLDSETSFYGNASPGGRGNELWSYPTSRSYFLALDLGL